MKFLVDAQLPRRLAKELTAVGHDAIHTLDLPHGNKTTDDDVTLVADREGRIVVTKDEDFRNSHLLRGTPRRLLRVKTGNIRNTDLMALFDQHLDAIVEAFSGADDVELSMDELIIHPPRNT